MSQQIDATAAESKGRNTHSHKALELALDLFDFYSTDTSEPVAIRKNGLNLALTFYGRGITLRSVLAEELIKRYGLILSDKAFREVAQILAAEAQRNPREITLRVGVDGTNCYVDLGDNSGKTVEITKDGWSVLNRSPIPFLRTILTVAMPEPERGGNVTDIFQFINIPHHRRDLFIGCLVASFFEDIPHPALNFDGEQGSGKSFAAQLFTELIDPSLVPRRKPPKDIETWTTTAQGSYVIGIDNVANLSPFFSDALCRAVTGDGNVSRELYTNGGIFVCKFRRLVILNGIRIGGIQDDLADRLIRFKFPAIPNSQRKTEREILRGWEHFRPRIYGSLLDLVSRVISVLPDLEMDEMPRMADFSRVLAALDRSAGMASLSQYLDEVELSALSSVSEDPYIALIKEAIGEIWAGSSKVLLERIQLVKALTDLPAGFPDSPKSMSSYLTKICPTLRKAGWLAEDLGSNNHDNVTIWQLAPSGD